MSKPWQEEYGAIAAFARDLESRPALPDAPPDDLSAHAAQVSHLQDLLALISVLAPDRRPPLAEWDDLLGPLWRRLFAKGDDVTRYILADLWRGVLLEAGELERYYRSTTAVAASARNFYRFGEAARICKEAREVSGGKPTAALANLTNTEGSVFLCQGDHEGAEAAYREALRMGDAVSDKELRAWTGLTRDDFHAQELINVLDVYFKRGYLADPSERAVLAAKARAVFSQVRKLGCSDGFRLLVETNAGEMLLLEGRLDEARARFLEKLDQDHREGPYRLSLSPMDGRLLSIAASMAGDWAEAYRWIRWAIKEGAAKSYPSEDQLVLEQAIRVLGGLYDTNDITSGEHLVRDLALLLEDKDWYTGRSHSRGVAHLALDLGKTLNETRGWDLDLEWLGQAGLLHDIGKLRVPWSLLNKIAPITPREWVLLRDHSIHGADLLGEMGMGHVGDVVLQHHEAMDGSGYPHGKAPDRMASIVAVCDVFEASVTPNRRYKDPKSRPQALAELRRGAGRVYNPEVVEALASRLDGPEVN
jgi:HD-GYP domain-containing protein (c-di-GMP phosphodiesterase class II)